MTQLIRCLGGLKNFTPRILVPKQEMNSALMFDCDYETLDKAGLDYEEEGPFAYTNKISAG